MIILFQNMLFLKDFLALNGCFGLFTKIKKGSGTRFWCTFFAWFFHKNVSYLIPYQWTKSYLFFLLSNIKPNVLLRFGRQKFKIYLGSSSKAIADREKKSRRWKYKNLKNEKSFLDKMRYIFSSFWRAIDWRKIKIW